MQQSPGAAVSRGNLLVNVYGLMLPDDNGGIYQVYIDKEGNPIFEDKNSEQYNQDTLELLAQHVREVDALLERKKEKRGEI